MWRAVCAQPDLMEDFVLTEKVSVLHRVSRVLLVQSIKQLLQLVWTGVQQVPCITNAQLQF